MRQKCPLSHQEIDLFTAVIVSQNIEIIGTVVAVEVRVKCTMLFALIVAKTRKFPLSLQETVRYIAATVSLSTEESNLN
jgi:hypothetical protein